MPIVLGIKKLESVLILLKRLHMVFLISTLLLISVSLVVVSNTTLGELALNERVQLELAEAFVAVAEAERLGGDVSGFVNELNQALTLLEEGEMRNDEVMLQGALSKVEDVVNRAPVVGQGGVAVMQARTVQNWLVVGVVMVLGLIVWRYEPRIFWQLWVRIKRRWKVKA